MDQVSSNAQPFRFLDLPGEIRNRIYEYALASDSGQLDYRITLHLRFQDYNRLKETAVAKKENLIMRKRSIIPAPMHGKIEFNRLEYVCKQLHKETAGIELKYNEVVFTTWADHMSEFSVYCRYLYLYASRPFWVHASLLDDFLKLCDYSPRSKWLTSVVLCLNPNDCRTNNDVMSKFVKLAAQICVANPKLEVSPEFHQHQVFHQDLEVLLGLEVRLIRDFREALEAPELRPAQEHHGSLVHPEILESLEIQLDLGGPADPADPDRLVGLVCPWDQLDR
ncbi:hypothetical protein BS50DRAFT_680913 [Corynespora cassiicola Philippines]|uniref:F-box domain-containing protein n=1 Tax=Corynespora cassiicola Philippines TaxID=1448308 RepID=A0A2T2N7U3_CORCC|nr:hypothetical protein BS50DRAFT_680913 [Corynespora cassiicola Philippines]